jgi:hypothetical protein
LHILLAYEDLNSFTGTPVKWVITVTPENNTVITFSRDGKELGYINCGVSPLSAAKD